MSGTTDPREGPTGPPPQSIAYPGTTDELEPTPDPGETSYVGAARLTDQVAIITGRDAGIGRATEPVACPFIFGVIASAPTNSAVPSGNRYLISWWISDRGRDAQPVDVGCVGTAGRVEHHGEQAQTFHVVHAVSLIGRSRPAESRRPEPTGEF